MNVHEKLYPSVLATTQVFRLKQEDIGEITKI